MNRMFLFALLLAGAPCAQAVELPRMFSDGMVLQRGQPLPVWGRATPGATVKVTFDGDAALAVADANGEWRVRLPAPALPVSGARYSWPGHPAAGPRAHRPASHRCG